MANSEHVEIIKGGPATISRWYETNPKGVLDLRNANLRRLELVHASIPGADFSGANLEWADFRWADLINVDFSGSLLARADFHKADMQFAWLERSVLFHTNFEDANLSSAEFSNAILAHTRFLNSDLSGSQGLYSCVHRAPSILGAETIRKSGHLPVAFLRGCGVTETAVQAIRRDSSQKLSETFLQEGEYYSVFISYSSKNEEFVNTLFADLQENGVRCWYAPEDLKIGEKLLDSFYEGIRTHEKLLLVLSSDSVESEWVEDEVSKAFAEERDRGQTVVFPVTLDDAVMHTSEAWAQKLKAGRHIGSFRDWQDPESYASALTRLLRDLKRS